MEEPRESASPGAFAREIYTFDDLRVTAATADSVVVATVEGTEKGRAAGDLEAAVNFTLVGLRVNEALKGDQGVGYLTMEVMLLPDDHVAGREASYASAGLYGESTFIVGKTFLVFLHQQGHDRAQFRQVNNQGVYLLVGDDVRALAGDGFSAEVAALSLGAIRESVASALRDVEAGRLPAQVPTR